MAERRKNMTDVDKLIALLKMIDGSSPIALLAATTLTLALVLLFRGSS
jgi:hypothetical protein